MPDPVVPRIPHPTYNPEGDEDGDWMENPFDPEYNEALENVGRNRMLMLINTLLNESVVEAVYPDGVEHSIAVMKRKRFHVDQAYILRNYAIHSKEDFMHVVDNAVLTETRVKLFFDSLQVTRHGEALDEAGLRNAINVGIAGSTVTLGGMQLVPVTDEYDACVASNMNWAAWCNCEYSLDLMAQTVALHRCNTLKSLHTSDAVRQAEKDAARRNH